MECSKINNGKYTVKLKLDKSLSSKVSMVFEEEPEFKDICSLKGNFLEYESETILPHYTDDDIGGKNKVFRLIAIYAIQLKKMKMCSGIIPRPL